MEILDGRRYLNISFLYGKLWKLFHNFLTIKTRFYGIGNLIRFLKSYLPCCIMGKKVETLYVGETVITEDSDLAREFYHKNRFGSVEGSKVKLSLLEAYYLLEKNKIIIKDKRKELSSEQILKKIKKSYPHFWTKYCVFRDLRNRGYVVKTALKFGADFRVYERGAKPGEEHAKWVVFPVHESSVLTWQDFSAKNRVAHSTKKRLLIGIVDDEGDVTYYEIRWMRP